MADVGKVAVQERYGSGWSRPTRESTHLEEQQSSYQAQIDYNTNYIQSLADWEFVGMYADEGISGTSTKHWGRGRPRL